MYTILNEPSGVQKNRRSRSGCQQCRAIKKKCDEQKPHCSLCKKRGLLNCNYTTAWRLKNDSKSFKISTENKVQKTEKKSSGIRKDTVSTSVELNCDKGLSTELTNIKPNFLHAQKYSSLVPIISQTKTFQAFLPFNISFKNQKILNFYEIFTSSFLTPGFPNDDNKPNPFKKFIPYHAHTNKNLMQLILLFSKIHMKSMGIDYNLHKENFIDLADEEEFDIKPKPANVKISDENILFLEHLATQGPNDYNDLNSYTLIQMVLISMHTFFPSISPINWRQCIKNARKGALNTRSNNELFGFLNHWISYQELLTSLTTSNLKLIQHNDFNYVYDVDTALEAELIMPTSFADHNNFDSSSLEIDEFSGMDRQTLKFLNQSVKLLQSFSNEQNKYTVQLSAMDLITQMEKFFFISDIRRQEIKADDLNLITTNKIFGKITVYILKRRILEMQISDSENIRFLLLEIIELINKLPHNTSYSSCLFFAMFISGSDLIIFDELINKRHIILNHLDSLHKNVGMQSCEKFINYMHHCWQTKKPWWEVFLENHIDIIFTI